MDMRILNLINLLAECTNEEDQFLIYLTFQYGYGNININNILR